MRVVGLCLLALWLAACSSAPPRPDATAAANVVLTAVGLVGTPYQWGGNTPASGFDCSGLVQYVYRLGADMSLPRTSHAMSAMDRPKIDREALESGDLVFFHGNSRRVSHVGIYVGDGRFVHAPNAGGDVRLDRLDNPYWSSHFSFGRRLLSPAP